MNEKKEKEVPLDLPVTLKSLEAAIEGQVISVESLTDDLEFGEPDERGVCTLKPKEELPISQMDPIRDVLEKANAYWDDQEHLAEVHNRFMLAVENQWPKEHRFATDVEWYRAGQPRWGTGDYIEELMEWLQASIETGNLRLEEIRRAEKNEVPIYGHLVSLLEGADEVAKGVGETAPRELREAEKFMIRKSIEACKWALEKVRSGKLHEAFDPDVARKLDEDLAAEERERNSPIIIPGRERDDRSLIIKPS